MFLELCDTDAASKLQDLLKPAIKKAAELLKRAPDLTLPLAGGGGGAEVRFALNVP
jgi:hypothetical protein